MEDCLAERGAALCPIKYTLKGTPQHIPSGMAGFTRQGIPLKSIVRRVPCGLRGLCVKI